MRVPRLCVLFAALLLAGCTGGVDSTQDLSKDLTQAYPLAEGTYRFIVSDDAGDKKFAKLKRNGADGYSLEMKGETPGIFRILTLPELPPTRYLVQLIDSDASASDPRFIYYFAIAAGDNLVVLSPSRYALDPTRLPDPIKAMVEVKDDDEIDVKDPAKTLAVLKLLVSKQLGLELFGELAKQ